MHDRSQSNARHHFVVHVVDIGRDGQLLRCYCQRLAQARGTSVVAVTGHSRLVSIAASRQGIAGNCLLQVAFLAVVCYG